MAASRRIGARGRRLDSVPRSAAAGVRRGEAGDVALLEVAAGDVGERWVRRRAAVRVGMRGARGRRVRPVRAIGGTVHDLAVGRRS